jgi:L-lactate dehydrogenase complex protein LldF
MKITSNDFIPAAHVAVMDADLRAAVLRATTNASDGRIATMYEAGYAHGEAVRAWSASAKRRALMRLPDLLEQAEANLMENGVHVLWAETAVEACRHVLDIAERHQVGSVVKSKSMISEEIGLNDVLAESGIDVVETDLGEYILQLDEEPPSHIVTPVIHKSKADVSELFVRKLGMTPTDDTHTMAMHIRQLMRSRFLSANMGISGGNFIVAETGTLGLVTNEGNGRMVTSLPKVHVALVGIEKIVESLMDFAVLTQVLPRSATGQRMTVYTHMINGPRQTSDEDGPEDLYVILVDNGRTRIYDSDYVDALACIRCGACMNACPVYRSVGGHVYGWVYPGPIGAVVTPLLQGLDNAKPLPNASSLCGACKQVCPVDIDLPSMLLSLRYDLYRKGDKGGFLGLVLKLWSWVAASPKLFELAGRAAHLLLGRSPPSRLPGPVGGWTKYRALPAFADRPFRRQWREMRGEHD